MPSPTQVVIFGASGDLTLRKLIPALAGLEDDGKLPADLEVVGVARREKTDAEYRALAREWMPESLRPAFDRIASRIHYLSGSTTQAEDLARLRWKLDETPPGETAGRVFYFSLKPDLFPPTVQALGQSGLLTRCTPDDPTFRRVVVEKPFGHDLASARALNACLHEVVDEHQIYRIDHFLGKETVQNLLGFRFHNSIFEPLWNRHHVELVQITVAESIGVEDGRAAYYDTAGAVKDMLQNHMLQVLALVAMEPPTSLEPEAVRDQKVQVLRGLHCPDAVDVARHSIRARYAAGEVDGKKVRGYLEEEGVPADSTTETYVALRAEIDTWRWSGVPFLLRHGKRLPTKRTEVKVQFRTPPLQLFNRPEGISDNELRRRLSSGELCSLRPNVLTLCIQPRETIQLSFGVKRPGPQIEMAPAELAFDYQERFGASTTPAYERLLLDAIVGDPTLYIRADEVEACWRYVDEVLGGWRSGEMPVFDYPAGSWGPTEADRLFYGCEGGWST